MKKALKILYVTAAVILVMVLAAALLIHFFADSALKVGIETAATKTLNVKVSVAGVKLSIFGGKLALQGLVINNPPGYKYERLLELKKAQILVNVRSLLSDTVEIREIILDGVNVTLEQRGISSNNIQDIIKTISAGEKPPTGQAQKPPKKLRIDNLEITHVTVNAKLLPIPGKVDTVTLTLSPIKMTNLGGDNNLDTAALTGKVLTAIAGGIAEKGTGLLPDEVTGAMKSVLGKTMDAGKGVIQGGRDIGKGVGEGLKGLFRQKK